jgi:flagellar basal-body rod modification protein FlgD
LIYVSKEETTMEVTNAIALENLGASQGRQQEETSDYDIFLRLMTAELKYQDPLDPRSSSEVSSDLAQFSAVEQQTKTNDRLNTILETLSASSMDDLSTWVGLEARATGEVEFTGAPIVLATNAKEDADRLELVVSGTDGGEVQRLSIENGSAPFEWTGVSDDGASLASGNYSFSVEAFQEGASIGTTEVFSYSTVNEARLIDGDIWVVLANGSIISADDVTGVRQLEDLLSSP